MIPALSTGRLAILETLQVVSQTQVLSQRQVKVTQRRRNKQL